MEAMKKRKSERKRRDRKKIREVRLRKRERSQKKDVKLKTPEDRLLWKLVGVALIGYACSMWHFGDNTPQNVCTVVPNFK